jgi:archaellum component FlaG (FlaF/FlaG flagellin family)
MRSGSALVLAAVLLAAAAVVAMPSSAIARSAAASSNSQTFTDSTGEDPNAPDITTIAISNDDAGLITFKVNISNRPTMTADMAVVVFLDTDRKASTGDSQSAGADYVLELDPGSVTLFKWNGTDFRAAPSQSSVTFGYGSAGATIRASAHDLSNTKEFNFFVDAAAGIATDAMGNPDFTNVHDDYAPDPGHGVFTYHVLTKLTLSVKAFTTGPKPAKAGKKFVASLAANESDTSGPVETGTVACSATVAGKHLTATAHRLANGIASCAWSLPRNATGTLRGAVSLTVQGTTVVRAFAVKVT